MRSPGWILAMLLVVTWPAGRADARWRDPDTPVVARARVGDLDVTLQVAFCGTDKGVRFMVCSLYTTVTNQSDQDRWFIPPGTSAERDGVEQGLREHIDSVVWSGLDEKSAFFGVLADFVHLLRIGGRASVTMVNEVAVPLTEAHREPTSFTLNLREVRDLDFSQAAPLRFPEHLSSLTGHSGQLDLRDLTRVVAYKTECVSRKSRWPGGMNEPDCRSVSVGLVGLRRTRVTVPHCKGGQCRYYDPALAVHTHSVGGIGGD